LQEWKKYLKTGRKFSLFGSIVEDPEILFLRRKYIHEKTTKMKKHCALFLSIALSFVFAQQASAQKGSSYENAVGMRVEFGSKYGTWAGLSGKHFFNENVAGEMMILFGDHVTLLEPELQYHGDIANADGLKWVLGFGPGFAFGNGTSDVLLRPLAGLDYKIADVPINFTFDWRPAFVLTHDTDFNAARFGLAVRYAF